MIAKKEKLTRKGMYKKGMNLDVEDWQNAQPPPKKKRKLPRRDQLRFQEHKLFVQSAERKATR